ncbi:MAG TPA: hypothetical protein VN736_19560 [Candidatus Limnocylindrales bacterium]|nr:hypothetical protein [Candidatus Limnocylindrales bacterium]
MRRLLQLALAAALCTAAIARHSGGAECGTTRETIAETMFRHRQMLRARPAVRMRSTAPRNDIGNIALVEDAGGVVQRQNQFNLDGHTLTFTPATADAARYTYAVATAVPDASTSASTPLTGLGDDDAQRLLLPFPFPFFGTTYSAVYVNSDGNLTFGIAESSSTQRSLGRLTAGPPRIAPLFDDLNPSQSGTVAFFAQPDRFTVTWTSVPEFSDTNTGPTESFLVVLYPDGRIQFGYFGVNPTSAVVGITPGGLARGTALVDFRTDPSSTYVSTVAEVFGNSLTIDIIAAAQQFYQTHDDAYDYLVIYNAMGIPALGEGTVAYEQTVRNSGSGYGVSAIDDGFEFGSRARLRAVLNLGPLSQFPTDPNALVPPRAPQHDTPLTILAHEAGHLFLAYASIPGATASASPPMLGFQLAHWSFLYDSEASLLEGERIADRGTNAATEFVTTDITQGYSPMDQYLMGFRTAAQTPDTFVVTNPLPNYSAFQHQFSGIEFNGVRRNISVNDIIAAEGPRIPDSTVAQRHFRFAFIVLTAAGSQPSAADLAQIDTYRRQFETFFAQAASGNAAADTTLKHALEFTLAPAAGVIAGASATGTVAIARPSRTPVTIHLTAQGGHARLPAAVTIPAGATAASFPLAGLVPGVDEVTATPSDGAYETAYARVRVAGDSTPELKQVGSNPLTVQLTDADGLPYPGAGILASPSADGAVVPAEAFTDAHGLVTFQWHAGVPGLNFLRLTVDGVPGVTITLTQINPNKTVH